MSKEGRSTNVQTVPGSSPALPSSLGFRNSFVIGNSSFVIRSAASPHVRCSAFNVGCSMFVLFITQRLHRIDLRGASGGQPARQERDRHEQQWDEGERRGIGGRDSVKQASN